MSTSNDTQENRSQAEANAQAMKDRTEKRDYDRLKYLEQNGYLPEAIVESNLIGYLVYRGVSPMILLDWILIYGLVPTSGIEQRDRHSVGRERIDGFMKEEAEKNGRLFFSEVEENFIRGRVGDWGVIGGQAR